MHGFNAEMTLCFNRRWASVFTQRLCLNILRNQWRPNQTPLLLSNYVPQRRGIAMNLKLMSIYRRESANLFSLRPSVVLQVNQTFTDYLHVANFLSWAIHLWRSHGVEVSRAQVDACTGVNLTWRSTEKIRAQWCHPVFFSHKGVGIFCTRISSLDGNNSGFISSI